jgi:hypothetical protein
MIHTPIIPNRQIIRVLPTMPDLKIMVINNQSQEPVQQSLALAFCDPVDVLHVVAESEDRLPPRDGIGADYGMHGDKLFADVFGSAALLRVDLESVLCCSFVEFGLGVGGGQAFEELLDGG